LTRETGEAGEEMIAAVAQFASTDDTQANIATIRSLAERARAAGAGLAIFPEAASYAFDSSPETLARVAREGGDIFRRSLSEIARDLGLYLVVGMYTEGDAELSENRLIVMGPDGQEIDSYQKLHLYDAFHYQESLKNTVAPLHDEFGELVLFNIGAFRFGLINCYDLRFPEMARALIAKGANALIVCAGWVAGPLKELHWETLLRARAIENTSYVLASSQPAPLSSGLSMIVDPSGLVLGGVAGDTGIAVAQLSMTRLRDVRAVLPSLEHRRYEVVQRRETTA